MNPLVPTAAPRLLVTPRWSNNLSWSRRPARLGYISDGAQTQICREGEFQVFALGYHDQLELSYEALIPRDLDQTDT
jgi:hypothetical protein